MAEEHEAVQHGEMDRPEDDADQRGGERHGAQPQEAERRRENQHRGRRQRRQDEAQEHRRAQKIEQGQQVLALEAPTQCAPQDGARDVEQPDHADAPAAQLDRREF